MGGEGGARGKKKIKSDTGWRKKTGADGVRGGGSGGGGCGGCGGGGGGGGVGAGEGGRGGGGGGWTGAALWRRNSEGRRRLWRRRRGTFHAVWRPGRQGDAGVVLAGARLGAAPVAAAAAVRLVHHIDDALVASTVERSASRPVQSCRATSRIAYWLKTLGWRSATATVRTKTKHCRCKAKKNQL